MITRRRIAIIYWMLFVLFMITQAIIIRTLMLRSFKRLEDGALLQNVDRFTSQINRASDQLGRTTVDWAWWDDTYLFAVGKDSSLFRKDLTIDVFKYLQIDYATIIDCAGIFKIAVACDREAERLDTFPAAMRAAAARLAMSCAEAKKSKSGIVMVGADPFLVSCASITPSAGAEKSFGTLMFARRLSKDAVNELAANAGASSTLCAYSSDTAYGMSGTAGTDTVVIRNLKKDSVVAYKTLRDIENNTALALRVAMPRTIYHSGWIMVTIANHVVTFLLIIFGLLIWRILRMVRRAESAVLQSEKLKALGVLAGGIAHDFNNLLTGIFCYVNLAGEEVKGNSKAEKDLAEASKTIRRARHLTQQLLTFAKGGEPVKTPVSIKRLLQETAAFAMSGSTHKFILSVPDDLWVCHVDEHQIAEVVDNIVVNARQAMDRIGTISIEAVNVSSGQPVSPPLKQGNYVKVTIRDQGKGISAKYIAKVFDPFFTTKEQGNGLGLAVAYSIVRKHQGHIELRSEIGNGTEVVFYLPASPAAVETPVPAVPETVTGKGVVLVVDDDDLVLKACGRMLARIGYTVETAHNGNEALAVKERYQKTGVPLQVGIVDLTIKGEAGGVAIIERLKKTDPSFVAIVSSGYSDNMVMANPRQYGASAALPKPYTYEELSHVVAEAFLRVRHNV
jgi:signal transduction histidine kinase/ActR/RegA family two-component response regulator